VTLDENKGDGITADFFFADEEEEGLIIMGVTEEGMALMGSAMITAFLAFLGFFCGGGDGVLDDDDAFGDGVLVGETVCCSVVCGSVGVVPEVVTGMEPIIMVCFGDPCGEAI
jgi:hypothetical protein